MANYVFNKLVFSNKRDLNKVLVNNEFSYANIVPMPTSPEHCPEKYLHPISEQTPDDFYDEGNWIRDNWTCGWSGVEDISDNTIWFTSPWSPPTNFYKALAQDYPDMYFEAYYCEENFDEFGGVYVTNKDGSISETEYKNDDLAEIYFELVGDRDEWFKDEKGIWRNNDDEGAYLDPLSENMLYCDIYNPTEVLAKASPALRSHLLSVFNERIFKKSWGDKYKEICFTLELDE